MKLVKYLGGPLIIAILAFICQIVDQLLGPTMPIGIGFGWIAFQAWAAYFIAGCTPKGGVKAFAAYVVGMVASIGIIAFGSALSGSLGFWAFPIAILILVVPTICTEKVELLNLTPIVFVGAGAFFAIMNYVPNASFTTGFIVETVYCLLGLALGYLTILIRGAYDAKYNS
ncbi:MAG: DUF1097 domain-containing protein [Anaerorhabdus sp.]|jgi:hypothetical protein|uniref:DUF1097 domain-containing protein n=1 Tax=Anaerorhabdus sp. TaxID=1872524 RepID=UPI002FC73E9A